MLLYKLTTFTFINVHLTEFIHYVSVAAWADNADVCSKQYAGTGALKTDFTR